MILHPTEVRTHSVFPMSYLHICGAVHSSRLQFSPQRASVQSDESPTSSHEPSVHLSQLWFHVRRNVRRWKEL